MKLKKFTGLMLVASLVVGTSIAFDATAQRRHSSSARTTTTTTTRSTSNRSTSSTRAASLKESDLEGEYYFQLLEMDPTITNLSVIYFEDNNKARWDFAGQELDAQWSVANNMLTFIYRNIKMTAKCSPNVYTLSGNATQNGKPTGKITLIQLPDLQDMSAADFLKDFDANKYEPYLVLLSDEIKLLVPGKFEVTPATKKWRFTSDSPLMEVLGKLKGTYAMDDKSITLTTSTDETSTHTPKESNFGYGVLKFVFKTMRVPQYGSVTPILYLRKKQ